MMEMKTTRHWVHISTLRDVFLSSLMDVYVKDFLETKLKDSSKNCNKKGGSE